MSHGLEWALNACHLRKSNPISIVLMDHGRIRSTASSTTRQLLILTCGTTNSTLPPSHGVRQLNSFKLRRSQPAWSTTHRALLI
ncbi:TPA: hypothetical protein N0F65_001483 [Lagenidium giganteum]|uniref:Uncharacterized protein n=1 Tax=Lagenidium giganteum TaxID=4803 RepID=A0AAV2Z4L0_9STRA|nr:TPA: hypothetical protein N0F65_001483 [Lagenidium giganteum]